MFIVGWLVGWLVIISLIDVSYIVITLLIICLVT